MSNPKISLVLMMIISTPNVYETNVNNNLKEPHKCTWIYHWGVMQITFNQIDSNLEYEVSLEIYPTLFEIISLHNWELNIPQKSWTLFFLTWTLYIKKLVNLFQNWFCFYNRAPITYWINIAHYYVLPPTSHWLRVPPLAKVDHKGPRVSNTSWDRSAAKIVIDWRNTPAALPLLL